MRVGVNYAWAFNAYGTNFGPPSDPPAWSSTLPRNLFRLHDMGVSVIRWFILANAFNYGPHPTVVRKDGETIASFAPPTKPDPTFLKHFELLLETFRDSKTGIQLIPSFVDFHLCDLPGDSDRSDLVKDAAKRDHFFQTMLDPMLDVASQREYRDTIFAFEVMNEPYWLTHEISKPIYGSILPRGPRIEPAAVKEFLRIALEHIKGANLPSTVGHRFSSDLQEFGPDCIGTVRQFHYYPRGFLVVPPLDIDGFEVPLVDSASLPSFQETRAILGEFATRDDSAQGDPWINDCHGADLTPFGAVFARLTVAEEKHYELALPWPDLDDDGTDRIKFSDVKQLAIKVFARGTFC